MTEPVLVQEEVKSSSNLEIEKWFDIRDLVKKFLKLQPIYYDENRIWWIWDKESYKWKMIDDVDLMNGLNKKANANTIHSQIKSQIIEAFKQEARKNKPKEIKPTWIQFGNKIIDIETEEEFEANPDYFVTNPIPYKLGESEETPEIDRLFIEWVGEEHKEELYEIFAFCLVPNYFIHRIFCLIGSGANGKSTYLKLLQKLVGEKNIVATNLENLMISRFEKSKLFKKLVCVVGETEFNTLKRTTLIKSLSGQDLIGCEIKQKNPFDFVNYAKLILASNSLPMTQDKTQGFYRRWKIIDFPNTFEKEADILNKIPDEEFENLCLKCLNIAKRLWKERTFTDDGNFEERAKKYEEKSNPLIPFINENYIKNPNGKVVFSEFLDNLNEYLYEKGYRQMSKPAISKQLKNDGYEIKTGSYNDSTTSYILGLKKKKMI